MKKLFVCAIALLVCATSVFAQKGAWSFSIGTDAATQYMWRGYALSNTPTLTPTATLNFEKDDFSFELGYCSITELQREHYLEMDVWASASFKGFTLMAQEYGCGNNLGIGGYSDNLELSLSYELPFEFLPLTLSWNTFVLGDDFNWEGENAKRAFSSYAEVALPYQFGNFSVCATAGAVPFRSDDMYETEGFKLVNLGLQCGYNFTIGDNFELPIYIQDTYNPLYKKNFVVLGCGLSYTFDL